MLVPVLTPLIMMVLLLDALMARVWLADAEGEVRRRYRTIVRLDLAFTALVFLVWLPFFMSLGR